MDASRIAFAAAVQADADGDATTALAAIQEAAALRPKHPTLALNAAAMEAQAGFTAVATLRLAKLADMGVGMDLRAQPAFEVLAGRDDFERIADRMAAHAEPVGETPLELRVNLGAQAGGHSLPEGLALGSNSKGDPLWYVSNVNRFGVLETAEPVTASNVFHGPGLSPFGIAYDPHDRFLWVTAAANPKQKEQGTRSRLVLVNVGDDSVLPDHLSHGPSFRICEEVEALVPGEQDAALGDLLLLDSSTALVSDAKGGTVWLANFDGDFDEGSLELRPWMRGPGLPSPQGLAQASGGIYLADYSTGLHRFSESGKRQSLAKPDDLCDLGIDGLASAGPRHLVAIQNGFAPQRILWLTLSEDGEAITDWQVLAAAQPEWREPTLGVVHGDWFYFIANSHWPDFADFENPKGPQGPPEIRKVRLPMGG